MFTLRSLTYTSDTLPALAGVADVVHRRTGSKYPAGLWEGNLLQDLQWRSCWEDENDQEYLTKNLNVSQYQAPTFSCVSINLSVFYNDYGPPEAEEIVYAVSVLKASCEVKGLNPFGEVSAGYILLEGPLFPQMIGVTWLNRESRMDCRLCDPDLNSSTYDLWVDCVYPDLPFAECCTSEGKKTVRRLTDGGKDFEPFQGVVQCLGICRREDNLRVALILGESATVDGAFERLGFL